MPHRGVEQLKDEFTDVDWRAKFVRIADLIEILGDCTIPDNYVISDALNHSIVLTAAGSTLRDRLVRKEGVQAKEAKLMCALALGQKDLFIDIEKTDLSQLVSAIDREIVRRRIYFPFIFGRELYDRYAELHEDEKDALTAEETLRLLEPLPIGVFQYGNYTIGPYGLRDAPTSRSLESTRRVPAYHCARNVCRTIHPVLLDTSRSAAINRDRDKFHEILQKTEGEAAEWWQFAAEVSGLMSAHFGDQRSATLIPLVGDSLSLPELQTLMIDLLDGTRGEVRGSLGPILGSKSASEMTGGLARAQLLQLMLFVRDELIGNSLDRLVRSGRIGVPSGEIRRPVIAGGMRSGAFRLRAELGEHGVRFASDDPGFALLRLRRVLDRLYVREAATDVEELEWQLRGIDVEDVDERLDHFFQRSEPRSVLERMVLARKTNMIAACEEVGLEDGGVLPDDELISTLMWKLGFSVTSNKDPHVEFWSRHERLWALAQSSEIGASERFLDSASPYFSRLEGILLDALAFTAWAFLTDHTTAHFPFTYDDEEDRIAGLALMQEIAPSPAGSADYTADRVDLANLVSGFSALGRRLEQCADDPDKYRRPDAELPDYDGKTSIKTFLLRSTVPFIDLTAPSRNRIVAGLREVTRILVNADVASVRNDYSHYRRNSPDVAKVEAALEATRQAVTRIETLGFCRLLFVPNRVTKDSWGRSRHEFVGPRSYEHLFTRPTRFDWMGLPPITEPAYLVRAASIGEPTEVLRFSRRYTSSFSEMWTGYPARRRTARTTSSEQQPVDHDAQVGAHVP